MELLMIKDLYLKYKEVIMYLVFGVLTTVVNIVVYFILRQAFGEELYLTWNAIAWVLSVLFAYVTNKKYVFESKSTELKVIIHELVTFFGFRLFSGILDMLTMYVSVNLLGFNDGIMKVVSNIIVVILNYVFSKLIIFKK